MTPAVNTLTISKSKGAVALCYDTLNHLAFEFAKFDRGGSELDAILLCKLVDDTLASLNTKLATLGETPGIDLAAQSQDSIVMVTCRDHLDLISTLFRYHHRYRLRGKFDRFACDGVLIILQVLHALLLFLAQVLTTLFVSCARVGSFFL